MIIIHKTLNIKSTNDVEDQLSAQDAFVSGGTGHGSPDINPDVMKIWNNGEKRLQYEFKEETRQEIEQRKTREKAESVQTEAYQNDLELWKNERVRPIRDQLMAQWVDHYASKPLWWNDLVSNNPDMVAEITATRQILLDWPATFTKYVTDQTIESKKPAKPSYITG